MALALSIVGPEIRAESQQRSAPNQPKLRQIEGNWVVSGIEKVSSQHIRLNGNLILERNARLELEDCTLEIVGSGSREHLVDWRGGTLVTRDTKIGGYVREDGVPIHTVFHLFDGRWDAIDTVVQYAYGVSFNNETKGILRGTRMDAGPRPDAIIASGKADIELTDSTFPIALGIYCLAGGSTTLDLPIREQVTATFDNSNTPGVEYRMKLTRHTVPDQWFVFLRRIEMERPPCKVILRDCPRVLVSLLGHNLQGEVNLSGDLAKPLKLGNLTLSNTEKPVGISMYCLYCTGDKTDLTVHGPAIIAELMHWGGKLNMQGTPGKNDLTLLCTTLEAKGSAQMRLENVHLGRPLTWTEQETMGEANVGENAILTGSEISVNRVVLHTRDKGSISLEGVRELGPIVKRLEGGAIEMSFADN